MTDAGHGESGPASHPEPMTLSLPAVPPQRPDYSQADTGTEIDREDVRRLEAQLIGGPRTLRRREAAASDGSSNARQNSMLSVSLTMDSATLPMTRNRANHQYSERLARPLKLA